MTSLMMNVSKSIHRHTHTIGMSIYVDVVKIVGSFQRLRFLLAVEVVVDEVLAVPPYISERYKVGRMLGDGNFAVVRECVEHSTGLEYALKIINKGKCRGKVS